MVFGAWAQVDCSSCCFLRLRTGPISGAGLLVLGLLRTMYAASCTYLLVI